MERHERSKHNAKICEEAAEWFLECRAGDLVSRNAREEFDRWLRKSPEHLSAYLDVAAIWNEGPSLDRAHKWTTADLIAQASAERDNVVALSDSHPLDELPPARKETKRVITTRVFGVAACLAIVVVGALVWWQSGAHTYTTTIGEQRSITLADGSTIELNSRSKAWVRYSEHERYVELLDGQALFHVAKDHARPFVVASGHTRVRAVGTQFDVYKRRSGTVVTVVEGQVAIGTHDATPSPAAITADLKSSAQSSSSINGMLLAAGEQVTVVGNTARKKERPIVENATAWTQRRIVFESASLPEVAEEFNRYNERQIVIESPDLYGFRIGGVFSSTDPGSLIRFLRAQPGIQVTESASEIRVSKKDAREQVTDH